jgi:signal transduction histidine kinase/FixJ family two-component response regulator
MKADDPTRGWSSGAGTMAELVRRFDWSKTPLGPIASWPMSLTTVVGVMLHSRQPMFLWWGPELIQIYNDAYLPSFGIGKHPRALGQPGRECWPEIWPIIGPQIDDVLLRGEPCWQEDALVPILRNGQLEDVYWTYGYSPVFDESNRIGGVLVVCTETTSRVAREAERMTLLATAQRERQSAEIANRAKDEFLTTASHELRTPLGAILGWARLLRAGKLDPSAYLRGIETIERNAQAQVRLIEDILDGSRIITGKLRLEIRKLDLIQLVRSALEAVMPAAEAKGINVLVELDPSAARLNGDPERLQQVVWNLVNNAIKFTPKGGQVAVRLKRTGGDIELTVSDTGQGIEAEFLPYVFDRFRQAEGSTTRRHGGLGLGLALVRHLVEAHGGGVRAESAGAGLGATFKARLPVQAVLGDEVDTVRPSPVPNVAPFSSAVSLASVSVLVVDDEPDARDLVATVLRAAGAEVTLATSALSALEALSTALPTVLVSDVGMPDVDGYELIRRVRSQLGAAGATLPAVALTAYAREEDRRLALGAGFHNHVAKPVEPSELLHIVATMAAQATKGQEPSPARVEKPRADSLAKLARVLAGGDVHEMLRFLNSRTPHRFTGIYRFDGSTLRNLYLFDAEQADLRRGQDAPMAETYCSIVGQFERAFTTADALTDDRLRTHPARQSVVSYCGVLLRDALGAPFGTLCHFDLVPCDVPAAEMPLMEAAARLLTQTLAKKDAT